MRYPEGIDKIDLLLNPLIFEKQNIVNHKDPYHLLTLHPAGDYWVLSIQAEWFNPFLDYQQQIAWAVYQLVHEGVLVCADTPMTPLFIYLYHWRFFLNVVAVEFYSDFKERNIHIDDEMLFPTIDEAKENGGLYNYYDPKEGEFTGTHYSPDKKGTRKSQFITYNKLKKSIKDNKASVKELTETQNPIRCEFKLYSINSNWLHWDNLRGNYQDIFNRYKRYLATIYNNQVAGILRVKGTENPNFKKVIKTAEADNSIRFKNRKHTPQLKQREVWSDDVLHPDKLLTETQREERRKESQEALDGLSVQGKNAVIKARLDEVGEKVGRRGMEPGKNQ